jgi:transposase
VEGAVVIGVHSRVPVFAYCRPADLRKGFEGLSALVRRDLGRDPIDGALYLFSNRRRRRAKVLYFDGTGLCVLSKRLEKGLFAKLWRSEAEKELSLTKPELELFLQGSQLVARLQLSPPPLVARDLRPHARARARSKPSLFVARRAGRGGERGHPVR